MKRAPAAPLETNIRDQEAEKVAELCYELSKPNIARYASGWLVDKLVTMGPFGDGAVAGTHRRYDTAYEHPERPGGFIISHRDVSRSNEGGGLLYSGYHGAGLNGQLVSDRRYSLSVLEPSEKRIKKGEEIFVAEHFQIDPIGSDQPINESPPTWMIKNEQGQFEDVIIDSSESLWKQAKALSSSLLGNLADVDEINQPENAHTFDGPLSALLERVDKSTGTTTSIHKFDSYTLS